MFYFFATSLPSSPPRRGGTSPRSNLSFGLKPDTFPQYQSLWNSYDPSLELFPSGLRASGLGNKVPPTIQMQESHLSVVGPREDY